MKIAKITPGSKLWLQGQRDAYVLATCVSRNGSIIKVETSDGKTQRFDMDECGDELYRANDNVVKDMTSLQHFHTPGILHNIRERAVEDEPYTFLGGSVLVAVNPLKRIKDPKGILGDRSAVNSPHPYAIAETAYQQLTFSANRSDGENQSIVIGGESGAGKTESSKMVMKHIVQRSLNAGAADSDLDQRLPETNPILEAFGNASTKRNPNSSRFGKFMKLHFKKMKKSRDMEIYGASVETYLLERSRVTFFGEGERNFHVFYQLVTGAKSKLKEKLSLTDVSFEYLKAKVHEQQSSSSNKKNNRNRVKSMRLPDMSGQDKDNFKLLCAALDAVGIPDQEELFGVLAALLHLGNVKFEENDESNSNEAMVTNEKTLKTAASLLGVKAKALKALFIDRKVKSAGETIIAKRDADSAKIALDAVVKAIYVSTFDWLVKRITSSLSNDRSIEKHPYIGILDIFGFESFQHNDFEQLLINYTNEALQNTFNQQIFEAEASLYEKEGMLVDAGSRAPPPDNFATMELLGGVKGDRSKLGILSIIDSETSSPQASDAKLNSALHRTYKKNKLFPSPHPKDVKHCFIIQHYAGKVQYTVGRFIEKNVDNLPNEVSEVLSESSTGMLPEMFASATAKNTKKKKAKTIAGRFKTQIENLIDTLDATKATFIRCIKPNPKMARGSGSKWFDDNYVMSQLENLSIPQTAEVLQGGLPTRLPFDELVQSYKSILPKDAIKAWKTLGQKDERLFVKALFEAFKISSSTYKMGFTMVFFKAGELESLNEVLVGASQGKVDKSIVKRFRGSFARAIWRRAIAKVRAYVKFKRLLDLSKDRQSAVTILQRRLRQKRLELEAKAELEYLREQKRKRDEAEKRKQAKREKEEAERLRKKQELETSKREKERLRLKQLEAEERAKLREREVAELHEAEKKSHEKHKKVEKELADIRKEDKKETEKTIMALGGMEKFKEQQKLLKTDKDDERYLRDEEDEERNCGHHEGVEDSPVFENAHYKIVKPMAPPTALSCFARFLGSKKKKEDDNIAEDDIEWTECQILLAGIECRLYEELGVDKFGQAEGKGKPIAKFNTGSRIQFRAKDDTLAVPLPDRHQLVIQLNEEQNPQDFIKCLKKANDEYVSQLNEGIQALGRVEHQGVIPAEIVRQQFGYDESHWNFYGEDESVRCPECQAEYFFLPDVEANPERCMECDAELEDPFAQEANINAYKRLQEEQFNAKNRKSMKSSGFPYRVIHGEEIIVISNPYLESRHDPTNYLKTFYIVFPVDICTNEEDSAVREAEASGSWSAFQRYHDMLVDTFGEEKLPEFPADKRIKNSKERAEYRLKLIEKYMLELLKARIPDFFDSDIVQKFFNLI